VDASLPKIRRLRATPVNVPLARPHPTASGVVGSAPLVLMDLETDQGPTGHAYVFCYTPIALKPIAELIEALQPLIQGRRSHRWFWRRSSKDVSDCLGRKGSPE
jgi:mandelate racemase